MKSPTSTHGAWLRARDAVLALLASLLLCATALAAPVVVNGKHGQQRKVTCESCHQTATPTRAPAAAACHACHGSYAELAEATKAVQLNPHQSHEGELPCAECHAVHKPPTLYCNQCHSFDLKVK